MARLRLTLDRNDFIALIDGRPVTKEFTLESQPLTRSSNGQSIVTQVFVHITLDEGGDIDALHQYKRDLDYRISIDDILVPTPVPTQRTRTMDTINVLEVDSTGTVVSLHSFSTSEEAEALFRALIEEHTNGEIPDDIEDSIEDGYWERDHDDWCIQMIHSDN
jgi:hypothetical protein